MVSSSTEKVLEATTNLNTTLEHLVQWMSQSNTVAAGPDSPPPEKAPDMGGPKAIHCPILLPAGKLQQSVQDSLTGTGPEPKLQHCLEQSSSIAVNVHAGLRGVLLSTQVETWENCWAALSVVLAGARVVVVTVGAADVDVSVTGAAVLVDGVKTKYESPLETSSLLWSDTVNWPVDK
ncbi:hypothetical protein RvY_12323 [Ramazzottius varieornatus]|uniref:Uncharacterized protein n=1 Tax=Ramazzottius varieornatus TaxID=947166 RepID=A0A1D1VJ37_RAMVA|nr:hypothetical protein RvY_12323 [Ramazzottius varieornatus]